VERILNEPTAAALDYGLANLTQCKNILVYDLGGGTLDITALELFEGVIDVKAGSGNNRLGGKDFDETLMRFLAEPSGDERALMRLKRAAEECKIALSAQESFEVSVERRTQPHRVPHSQNPAGSPTECLILSGSPPSAVES